jgi:hypothetical protein
MTVRDVSGSTATMRLVVTDNNLNEDELRELEANHELAGWVYSGYVPGEKERARCVQA